MDDANPFLPGYSEPVQMTILEELDREPKPRDPKPEAPTGHVRYHMDIEQGSMEWMEIRRGLLTASEMKLVVSPPPKPETRIKKNGEPYKQREWDPVADTNDVKTHLYELLAQRVTGYVEPHYQSYDMERGNFDEEHARAKYGEEYETVTECGFVTNDRWGFTIGYSPDGLVGDDGLIECKSRIQKWQMRTLIECVAKQEIPDDFVMQVQTALLVSERKWCDFVSYSGGMLMATVRVYPDPIIHAAIVEAATAFEDRLAEARKIYDDLIASDARLIPTERLIYL